MPERVLWAITHPLTALSVLAGGVLQYTQPAVLDAVIGAVAGQLGTLFAATSIAASTVAPAVEWLPAGALQSASLVVGGLYVVVLLERFADGVEQRL